MKKVLVIGAGVSGLTTALVLARDGHDVTTWAKDLTQNTTSAVAAAFVYPFHCEPRDKVIAWTKFTREYLESAVIPDLSSGVRSVRMVEYFDELTPDPWWEPIVDVFGHVPSEDLPQGYKDGYYAQLALMDTSLYLPWLIDQLSALGVLVEQRAVTKFSEIPSDFELIVNCSGLGSRELCNDDRIFPTRGQVLRVKSEGFDKVVSDDTAHNSLAYIIPRVNDTVLGGTAQENDWNLEVDPKDTADILEKAKALSPLFANPEILEIKVGLRPSRDAVRLELEEIDARKVIHNYGHGGSGYTISWGCAQEIASILRELEGET